MLSVTMGRIGDEFYIRYRTEPNIILGRSRGRQGYAYGHDVCSVGIVLVRLPSCMGYRVSLAPRRESWAGVAGQGAATSLLDIGFAYLPAPRTALLYIAVIVLVFTLSTVNAHRTYSRDPFSNPSRAPP